MRLRVVKEVMLLLLMVELMEWMMRTIRGIMRRRSEHTSRH